MAEWIQKFDSMVWGGPLIIALVGTGLYLTVRLRLVQLRGFVKAVKVLSGRYDDEQDPGEISHFQALATALSATFRVCSTKILKILRSIRSFFPLKPALTGRQLLIIPVKKPG